MRRTERIRHQQKRSKIEFFGSSFDDDGGSGGGTRKANPVHDELDRDLGEARRAFHTGRLKEAKQMLESIKSRAPAGYPQGPVDELLRKTNNGLNK